MEVWDYRKIPQQQPNNPPDPEWPDWLKVRMQQTQQTPQNFASLAPLTANYNQAGLVERYGQPATTGVSLPTGPNYTPEGLAARYGYHGPPTWSQPISQYATRNYNPAGIQYRYSGTSPQVVPLGMGEFQRFQHDQAQRAGAGAGVLNPGQARGGGASYDARAGRALPSAIMKYANNRNQERSAPVPREAQMTVGTPAWTRLAARAWKAGAAYTNDTPAQRERRAIDQSYKTGVPVQSMSPAQAVYAGISEAERVAGYEQFVSYDPVTGQYIWRRRPVQNMGTASESSGGGGGGGGSGYGYYGGGGGSYTSKKPDWYNALTNWRFGA